MQGCRVLLGTTAMLAVTSIGIANILVLMRVVMLWDGNLVRPSQLMSSFAAELLVRW